LADPNQLHTHYLYSFRLLFGNVTFHIKKIKNFFFFSFESVLTYVVQNNPKLIQILKVLYLETNMPNNGLCAITICKTQQPVRWKKVTEYVITKGQTNNTLPRYIQIGDTICLNCYNGIVVNCSLIFQQHALESSTSPLVSIPTQVPPPPPVLDPPPTPPLPPVLSFSKAIETITKILYTREKKDKKSTIYSFDEFRAIMKEKDVRLKLFFEELYLFSNPSSKNENSRVQAKKQLLFVCYFLCGIRNKFVNDAKGELTMYLDSTGVSNASIDTLADLGVTTTSRTISRHKTNVSDDHAKTVDSKLVEHAEKAMILNIDDYHSIHTKRMPNTTTTSTAAHLATILMNPITTQCAIPNRNLHNPRLVDAELIKLNLNNRFMMLQSLLHN